MSAASKPRPNRRNRVRPCDWLTPSTRRLFGTHGEVEWLPASPGEESELAAAKEQHSIATLVIDSLRPRNTDRTSLANSVGVSPAQLNAFLRGSTSLLAKHRHGLAAALNIDLAVHPQRSHQRPDTGSLREAVDGLATAATVYKDADDAFHQNRRDTTPPLDERRALFLAIQSALAAMRATIDTSDQDRHT